MSPSSSSPDDDLKQKQAALKKTQDEIKKLTAHAAALQAEITTGHGRIAAYQRAVAGYERHASSSQTVLTRSRKTIADEKADAGDAIKQKKKLIDTMISESQKRLETLADHAEKAMKASQHAAAESRMAAEEAEKKQSAYEMLKRDPQDTDARLREVAMLLSQAGRAKQQADPATVYVLMEEAEGLTGTIKVLSADQYKRAIQSAQDDAEEARAHSLKMRAHADKLSKEYAEARQKLVTAQKSRRTDLLQTLKGIKGTPA